MNCPVCGGDETKFWLVASVAVCFNCDTNWRPRNRAVVRSASSIDFNDGAAIDDFITELLASVPARTDRTSDFQIDVLVRFVGPDEPPTPPDFHRIILAGLAQQLPGVLLFWNGGGTPLEFWARVAVAEEQTEDGVADRVRSALDPWRAWEVVAVTRYSGGDAEEA